MIAASIKSHARISTILLVGLLTSLPGCWSASGEAPQADNDGPTEKVGHFPMRSEGPKTLDPVKGSTVYDNRCCCQIIETLVQYKYLKRPYELEPLLLTRMPEEIDTPDELLTTAAELDAAARVKQQTDWEAA